MQVTGSRCNACAAPATVTGDESRIDMPTAEAGRAREEDDPAARRPAASMTPSQKLRREVIVSSLLLLIFLATAQVPARVNDQIVVTASALPETVESTPASVTVITKDDIDKRAARDV